MFNKWLWLAMALLIHFTATLNAAAAANQCSQIFTTSIAVDPQLVLLHAKIWNEWFRGERSVKDIALEGESLLPTYAVDDLTQLAPSIATRMSVLYSQNIELKQPRTMPRSGAEVYLLRGSDEDYVGVYKIYNSMEEMTRELITNDLFQQFHLLRGGPPALYRAELVGKAGSLRPALLMEYVPHFDMEARLTEMINSSPKESHNQLIGELNQALQLVAGEMAELHRARVPGSNPISAKIAQSIQEYEIQHLSSIVDNLPTTFSPELAGPIRATIMRIMSAYASILPRLPAAFVHGDAHPGNVVENQDRDGVRFIDTETALWSVERTNGKVMPVGDPLADVGRFLAAFELKTYLAGFSALEIEAMKFKFMQLYSRDSGIAFADVRLGVDFYFLRFAGVILYAHGPAKNSMQLQAAIKEILEDKFRN